MAPSLCATLMAHIEIATFKSPCPHTQDIPNNQTTVQITTPAPLMAHTQKLTEMMNDDDSNHDPPSLAMHGVTLS
jgi:hypothetical protein